MGKALLYYERAKRLIPRDSDLRANYEYARSLIKGPLVEERIGWINRLMRSFTDNFTLDGITCFISFIYLLAIIVAIIWIYVKIPRRYMIFMYLVIAMLLIFGIITLRHGIKALYKEAVVVVSTAEAKFEPFDRATTHFTLSEGMKVGVVAAKGGWLRVKRVDSKVGWVPTSAVEHI